MLRNIYPWISVPSSLGPAHSTHTHTQTNCNITHKNTQTICIKPHTLIVRTLTHTHKQIQIQDILANPYFALSFFIAHPSPPFTHPKHPTLLYCFVCTLALPFHFRPKIHIAPARPIFSPLSRLPHSFLSLSIFFSFNPFFW